MRRIALLVLAFTCLLAGGWLPAYANQGIPSFATVRQGERLSDWVLRQPTTEGYMLGLSWHVPAQRLGQAKLKNHLLARLATMPSTTREGNIAKQRLSDWLSALPVTGRVPVPMPDARWLQAHPDQDPILESDHALSIPARPSGVTVVTETAEQCITPHRPGTEALGYLRSCQPKSASQVDHAWVIQPDGRARRFAVAAWNRQVQDEPAPGAFIWAPARNADWPEDFSAMLAEFLATQSLPTDAISAPRAVVTPLSPQDRSRDAMLTANDWGTIGVLQTPSARMAPASDLRVVFNRSLPYSRSNIFTQPLDWLEVGFRYTAISNRGYYGGTPGSGEQTFKDKSIDFKAGIVKETAFTPALAVGMIDVGGTGLFSSEYVVASKRYGDFDASLGMAWGYLGGRADVHNPLSRLMGSTWNTRDHKTGLGGTISTNTFFRGPAALFGGVQYQTPWDNIQLKLEYDGNNYQREPLGNNFKQTSPINAGIVYRVSPYVDLTAGIERGNTLMVNITFQGVLEKMAMPKLLDPLPPVVRPGRPQNQPNWSNTVADVETQTQWTVREIRQTERDLRVEFEETAGAYRIGRMERAVAVLHRDAPATVDRFVLVLTERGIAMSEEVVFRDAWVDRRTRFQALNDRLEGTAASEPRIAKQGGILWTYAGEKFKTGLAPRFRQILGGGDGFYFYELGVSTPTEWRITDRTWISGNLNYRLLDNYANYKVGGGGSLPRVRTYQREYFTTSRTTLPNLQITHIDQVGRNQYASLYGGYLEWMFAGVGAEWLYRPWRSPFAFGVDVNRVQQRDFRQDFAMMNPAYQVTTGHATLYLETGWKSTMIKLSAGQYLAGDRGITMDISRTFANGATLGAWASKTNVTAEQFGEGSFDKGVYLSIPFDAILPRSGPLSVSTAWRPIQKDGGQKLERYNTLYDLTDTRSKRSMSYHSTETQPWKLRSDSVLDVLPERTIFGELTDSTLSMGPQIASAQWGTALVTGGAMVLAASVLDKPMDRWANRHQSSTWNGLGKAANNIPLVLGIGTSLLWAGLADEMASETAWSSLKAAAITLGAETLAKSAIGRTRPYENLGAAHFEPFGSKATNASMPSIHMGISYALVAPFAQKYDADWLYAVAGATAFGRIQSRQHFVSDTVAGGLIGYAIGSLMAEQQRNRRNVPRITLGADRSIQASWEW